jgi:NADH-quinone oxidoreductase subunit J
MRPDVLYATLVIVLGGVGTWLLLPHRLGQAKPQQLHLFGALMTLVALVAMAVFWTPPGDFLIGLFFYGFAFLAVMGGVLTITSRSPVHSALWFASVILSTSGLFLLSGAAFLAAGTVIVYAGAIIVTFLFVIMLAQAEGLALYDRAARSPQVVTLTVFVILWSVLYSIATLKGPATRGGAAEAHLAPMGSYLGQERRSDPAWFVANEAVRVTARQSQGRGHVAGLGQTLYTDHLLAAELVGVLLFVALVGAAAIATPKAPVRPGIRRLGSGDPAQARALEREHRMAESQKAGEGVLAASGTPNV